MLIEPRAEILDIWRSVVDYSFDGKAWQTGGRSEGNSISDAEQLLCILYPATQMPMLRLDSLDEIPPDALEALEKLGRDIDVIRALLGAMNNFFHRYVDADGKPTFGGGSYLAAEWEDQSDSGATPEQMEMDVVDSFSMSVTLCLAVTGFLQVLRGGVTNQRTIRQINELQKLASDRLTAAMAGLLRSFAVHVFERDSTPGKHLIRTLNQSNGPERIVAEDFSRSVNDIRSRLREEITIGSTPGREDLENPNRLFECGWSWGTVRGADAIEFLGEQTPQRDGVADDRPYLYFTGVALDGIQDLFSERTRVLGLLNDDQQRLAASLQLRWDLTLSFWNQVATFGSDRWPVEDVPWRTTDGVENDYFTLFTCSIVVQRIQQTARERVSPAALIRIGQVLEELATRGRITRRPMENDQALTLHAPGIRVPLEGSELVGPRRAWIVSSYASLLLKRTIATASLIADTADRDRIISLADQIWEHLLGRRLDAGPGIGLWDQPVNVLPVEKPPAGNPSWYHTERVVECLVTASSAIRERPRTSQRLSELAGEFLAEAEHLYDREKLNGTPNAGLSVRTTFQSIAARLDRARDLRFEQPATSIVLMQDVLRDIDVIATARTTPHDVWEQ
jgi:hypothetical protein